MELLTFRKCKFWSAEGWKEMLDLGGKGVFQRILKPLWASEIMSIQDVYTTASQTLRGSTCSIEG